jgi:hypothetical protein
MDLLRDQPGQVCTVLVTLLALLVIVLVAVSSNSSNSGGRSRLRLQPHFAPAGMQPACWIF